MGVVSHDPVDRAELIKAVGIVTPSAATAGELGSVFKAAAVADLAAAAITDAPAGGTGTAAGGWDTAVNRDAAIATINACIDSIGLLEVKVNDLLAKLRTAGVLTA